MGNEFFLEESQALDRWQFPRENREKIALKMKGPKGPRAERYDTPNQRKPRPAGKGVFQGVFSRTPVSRHGTISRLLDGFAGRGMSRRILNLPHGGNLHI